MYNSVSGNKKRQVAMYCKFIAPAPTQSFRVGTYGGLPSIVSTACTAQGIVHGTDGGLVCKSCKDLRRASGSLNPGTLLNRWYTTLSRAVERREKETLTHSDLSDANNFIKTSDALLTSDGLKLKDEAKAQHNYGKYMAQLNNQLPNKTYKIAGEGSAPGMKSLFGNAEELCKKNPSFRSSIIVALFKAACAKEQHGSNAATDEKVVNFFRYISTYDKKAAQVMSANLGGPSQRWMATLNAREREDCILDSGDNGERVISRMEAAIARRSKSNGAQVSFSLAIDATKVPTVIEASSGYKAIVGGEFPNHLIDVETKSKEEIQDIIDGKSKEYGTIPKATEIKVTVMTFQGSPPGIPASEVVAARPQSNNESNEFIKSMTLAASSAAVSSGVGSMSFTNFAVDGVSCESSHVWTYICDYLSGQSNFSGATDCNHNVKSQRHQVIGGGGSIMVTIGTLMIDADLLRLGNVSQDLTRPVDFSSDLLVLKLLSFTVIQKIGDANPDFGSTSDGDKGALALTLFFMRLHLHAVNDQNVKPTHRAVYLWCSMLWFLSIDGASVITKRNMVSETITFLFLFMRSDVTKTRINTSEPVEHTFGMLRQMIREFSTLEFAQLFEKLNRRLKQMYKHSFNPSRDPQKGYQATYKGYFDYTMDTSDAMMEGTVNLLSGGDFVVNQLWKSVSGVISFSSKLMKELLSTVGVSPNDLTPFCRDFKSPTDLRDEFIRFLPSTFSYDEFAGAATAEEDKSDEDSVESGVDDDAVREASVVERIGLFAREMSEEDSSVDEVVVVSDNAANVSAPNAAPACPPTQSLSVRPVESDQLMSHFRSILEVKSVDDLFGKVLVASSYLDGASANVEGSISSGRKAKSLVARWFAKPSSGDAKEGDGLGAGDVAIERDTIILANATIGRGGSSATVPQPFRVLGIYDKHYNKWVLAKQAHKVWKNESKKFKLDVRMLEKDVLGEYRDVGLCGSEVYRKKEICKTIEDEMILGVVGKLQDSV